MELNLTWQLSHPEKQKIDPLLFSLLSAIKQQGSLNKARQQINVSYRFSWGLLNKWQKLLGQPLVILERGRGAQLSLIGEKLVSANAQLLAQFSPELEQFSSQFSRQLSNLLIASGTSSLTLYASHGLAINELRSLLSQQEDLNLDLHFHGSLASLRSLQSGDCDIAGFHIPIGPLAKPLTPQYLQLLDRQKYALVYVISRNQGLIVQQGNPKQIESISSLSHGDCEFINRQNDSGTRLLFDQLLVQHDIDRHTISGYHNEEFTHIAVAAMIASGIADVGFGIAPMAEKFKLDFIPIVWEHYCLAIPIELINDQRITTIRHLLHSDEFKNKLIGYSGYDVSRCGEQVSFTEIFS